MVARTGREVNLFHLLCQKRLDGLLGVFIRTFTDMRIAQVAAFINFYLTHVDDEIGDIGYFPASPAAISVSRQAWLDAQ